MTTPGNLLKAWREENGLSQTEAGKRLEPPVSQGGWGAWETGRKPPNLRNALQLEDLTGGFVPAVAWTEKPKKRAARRAA